MRIILVMSRSSLLLVSLLFLPNLLLGAADLEAWIEAPPRVAAGAEFAIQGTVRNLGPDRAENVVVRLQHGQEVCSDESFPLLPAGASVEVRCTVSAVGLPPAYQTPVTLTAHSSTPDPSPGNDVASRYVEVVTPPDLAVWIPSVPPGAPGLPVPVEVWYQNTSWTTAIGATLTLQTGTRIVRAPEGCTIEGERALCSIERVEAKASAGSTIGRIAFEVQAPASAMPYLLVAEIASAEGGDPTPWNNRAAFEATAYWTYVVETTADSGPGSLRAAIDWSNTTCGLGRPDCLIAFSIPSSDAWATIRPLSALPQILEPVVIDGSTQTAYRGDTNPAGPEIEISGGDLPAVGFDLASACGATVRGLAINGFRNHGILAASRGTCAIQLPRLIEGNYIGVDPTGSFPAPNDRGVWIGSGGWIIRNNVISANRFSAIWADQGQAAVEKNILGLDAALTKGLGNGASGVFVNRGASGTDIRGNHIGFNGHFGVAIASDANAVSVGPNSFQANHQHGIDWGLDGAATLDPVPIPVITEVRVEDGRTIITGTSSASGTFQPGIQIYANDAPDPSGYGEGQYFLGELRAEGVGLNLYAFTFVYEGDLRGKWITATATRHMYFGWAVIGDPSPNGDTGWGYQTTTSEFSRAFEVR